MTTKAEALIFTADYHSNHRMGLCPPSVKVKEMGTHKPKRPIRWMWHFNVECWQEVRSKTQGMRLTWFQVGDAIDLDVKKRGAANYITQNKSAALKIAIEAHTPGLEIADQMYLIRGTDAHTGNDCEYEEMLADDFDITIPDKDTGTESTWLVQGVIGGLKLHASHAVTMGHLPWTEANGVNKFAEETVAWYTKMGDRSPDLSMAAHVHRTYDTYDNNPNTRAIILPCWQLQPNYIKKKKILRYPDIGMVLFIVKDGEIVDEYKWIEKFSRHRKRIWANQL